MIVLPVGITFSFFWKNQEEQSRFAVASGGKVISNGFSVYVNSYGGHVEFYTRGNNHRWKANIKIPGTVSTFALVLHGRLVVVNFPLARGMYFVLLDVFVFNHKLFCFN